MLGLMLSKVVCREIEIEEEECWWDLVVNEEIIFCRLPAKELERLKTVCKNWYRVISSPDFVGFHLSKFNERRVRVLIKKDSSTLIEYKNYSEIEEIRYPPLISGKKSMFLGSCNGLLCLILLDGFRNHTVVVYNPSTGKCFWLKRCSILNRNHMMSCSWFGYHPSLKEYILVLGLILPDSKRIEVGVYKLSGSSRLERIHSTQIPAADLCSYTCYREKGILLHGAVHWVAKRGNRHVFSVYHLDTNEYSEILSPAAAAATGASLGVNNADGCLFTIFKSATANAVFEMWVMKEYGIEQSWTKCANIQGFDADILKPLGFFPNGDLIFNVNRRELTKYSFDDNKRTLLLARRNFEVYDLAEVLAIKRGAQLAKDNGHNLVIFESDSQIVIRALVTLRQDFSYVGLMVRDVRDLAAEFEDAQFFWASQLSNCVAHLLSVLGLL